MDIIARYVLQFFFAYNDRVLFNIRLNTQISDNDMASGMARLTEINDQANFFAAFNKFNPVFRFKQWRAQRFSIMIYSDFQ